MKCKLSVNVGVIVLLLVVTIGLGNLTSALGVTPAMRTVKFEAGKVIDGSFSVINTDMQNIELYISKGGDLNGSLELYDQKIDMNSSQGSKDINYKLTLPSELSPGMHTADILIMQPLVDSSQNSSMFLTTAIVVKPQIGVFVAYPGKYLEAALDVIGAPQGGEVTFLLPMVNKGQWDLERVRANIDIYDSRNNKIESFNSAEMSIKSGERKEISETWSADVPAGNYKAVVTLIFDENTVKLEGKFAVGDIEVELQEVTVKDYQLGGIAKFEMLVENKWGEQVRQIYSQTQVYNEQGDVLADFKSPTYDINAATKNILVSYWDTAGVTAGNYSASVFLRYAGDKSSRKDLQFNVQDDRIEIFGLGYAISEAKGSSGGNNNTLIVLLGVVIVLLLINSAWFLMLRRRLKGK